MPTRILTALSLLTLLLSNLAQAQNPPLGIQDEGGTLSYPAYRLDCVGAGISCSHSGTTGTITVTGSGSSTFTTQEEDSTVDAATDTLDFQECFDLTSSPSGEANVSFDSSECTVNANALKADGANCSAGEIPLGVDTAGAVQGCYEPAAGDIASGTFADARIAESNVTQHEAALTITESQISDLSHTTDTTLTQEEVEDYAGSMVTGNTETRISVTYQDADGTFDFVVDDMNDDVPESGDFGNADDLEATGELSADVVDQSKIADDAIQEEHLKAVDTASDEECLTFEETTGDFEWQTCGGGGGASQLSDLSDVNSSTATNRNVLVADGVDFESRALVEADISDLGSYLTSESNDLSSSVTWANVPDANITEGSVTQHESALTITESQVSDLDHTATDITAGIITEGDLNADNAPVDGDFLQYDSTGTNFVWRSSSETLSDIGAAASSHNHAASDVNSGTFADARIAESNVTQHEAALTITESQISDLSHTTDTNTNASTECSGSTTYLDGEGNCDDISSVYEAQLNNEAGLYAALSDVANFLQTGDAIAGDDITDGSIDSSEIGDDVITHADILDSDQADTKCFTFYESDGIDADDDLESIWANKTANNFLITEIWCETDTGTVTAMFQVDDGSPADVDSSDIVCDSNEQEDTSLNGDTTVAAGEELDWAVTSTASTPTSSRVCFTGNWVD